MTGPALDSCLKLIANRRRREIIQLLRAEEGAETTVDALLERLVRETESAGPPPDSEPLAVELHHIHLPKLAAHGVIEYEPESSRVRYRPDGTIEAVLESLPDDLTSVPT